MTFVNDTKVEVYFANVVPNVCGRKNMPDIRSGT
jgi:hypothetical protein